MDWEIRPLDPNAVTEPALRAIHAFNSAMQVEVDPEVPPHSLAYTTSNFQSFTLISSVRVVPFYAWSGDRVIGKAFIVVGLESENRHMLWGDVEVLAEHRGRGIGQALLAKVVQTAEAEDRRLIMSTTTSAIPAGAAFARRVGASVGLDEVTSELRLERLNHELLAAWRAAAPAEEFRLLTWFGAYPDEHLEAMAALHEVMNTAPKGELDYEDERVTPQDLRESEAYGAARNVETWTVVAQHKATGELEGFTEVGWHADKPRLLEQRQTLVVPKYRRSGVGRWLKATMISLVLQRRKSVTRLLTTNADSNAEMLRINEALGYQPYRTDTEWQLETARALAYLAGP